MTRVLPRPPYNSPLPIVSLFNHRLEKISISHQNMIKIILSPQVMPVGKRRCRITMTFPLDDRITFSLISCQFSPRCENRVGHRDVVAIR